MKLNASPPISPYQPIAKGTNSLVKPSKGTKFKTLVSNPSFREASAATRAGRRRGTTTATWANRFTSYIFNALPSSTQSIVSSRAQSSSAGAMMSEKRREIERADL